MDAELNPGVAFHLTGRRAGETAETPVGTGLRPALFAAYRDLTRLRYDYPLVLHAGGSGLPLVEPLSALVDRTLARIGGTRTATDRMRTHALRLERDLRAAIGDRGARPLVELLDEVLLRLAPERSPAFFEDVRLLRSALPAGGEILDCDSRSPGHLVAHLWQALLREKADVFHRQVDTLILRLADILRVDRGHSEAARTPASLRASVGAIHGEAFDFEAMSRMLAGVPGGSALTESRHRRIESTLAQLESQRYYPTTNDGGALDFRFDHCASALAAFRQRVPGMARLARAITIARLEIEGTYSEPRHDALFEQLAGGLPDPHDLALFPDYLVCVNSRDLGAAGRGEVLDILASGLPIKVLLQIDDLLEAPLVAAGKLAFSAETRKFASMAVGLGDAYVVQSTSSHLYRCCDQILAAMRFPGPALISVFSGANAHSGDLPPYLVAAAAMESRAFPAFTFDPAGGPDSSARFSIDGNPQAERDWPVHDLGFEDAGHERVSEPVAFTLLDFVACDRRHAGHFSKSAPAGAGNTLVPASELIGPRTEGLPNRLPSLAMVDAENYLHRVIVDEQLVREAFGCRAMWRSLQRLGGVGAPGVPARPGESEGRDVTSGQAIPESAPSAGSKAATVVVAPAAASPPEERNADEAYVETPRCSSCNECIQINGKMFAYDANKQARLVDPKAGTYRQLVEAAESCQVAIIHPGKPLDPSEAGLEDLLRRAESFL